MFLVLKISWYREVHGQEEIPAILEWDNITVSEMNTDVIATFSEIKLATDLTFSGILGANRRDFRRSENSSEEPILLSREQNLSVILSTQTINAPIVTRTRTNSVYGSAKFDYKGYLYAEFTGRNDWFSVINKDAFYPAASLGFVFSDAFEIQSDVFSYGKLRASWAQVSNAPGAYKNALNYTTYSSYDGQSVVNIKNTSAPNANLTFQSKTGIEFGFRNSFL